MTREFVTIKADGKEWAQPMTTREYQMNQYVQGVSGEFVRIPSECIMRTFRGLKINLDKNLEIINKLGLE